jgi:hypothetical protein
LIFNPTFFMWLWVKRDHRFWPIPRCFQASKLWYQMFLQYMTLYDKYQIFIPTHIIFIYIYYIYYIIIIYVNINIIYIYKDDVSGYKYLIFVI